MTGMHDLAIIGAGPAGMGAALEACAAGLSVVVLDEQPRPGGQIYRNVEQASDRAKKILGADYAAGARLVEAFRRSPARYLPGATVCHVGGDLEIGMLTSEGLGSVRVKHILVATGAVERPFPVPGWTLPGVLTAGGVQATLKASGSAPEGKVVMAGTGPLAYLLATQLLDTGLCELTFLDTTPRGNYLDAMPSLPRALLAGSYLLKGLRLLARLRASAARYVAGVESVEMPGTDRVAAVRYRAGNRGERLEADWAILHQGVVPNTQVTRALRCEHAWNPRQLCWQPRTDEWGGTSRPGVSVAGDNLGIIGARAAEISGRLSALGIAAELGLISAAAREARARQPRAELRHHLRIRGFLDDLYRPRAEFRIPEGNTIVCRCEDVVAADIDAAVALGCRGPNQAKFFTRCGMGPCQGRYCGLTVSEMIASRTGLPMERVGYYRVRQPIKPIRLSALATAARPVEKSAPYSS